MKLLAKCVPACTPNPSKLSRVCVWLLAGTGTLALAAPLAAQNAPAQNTPQQNTQAPATAAPAGSDANDPHRQLSAALAKLARNPRDLDALQQAGEAALALGDVPAATGFLSRADRLLPYNPRIMASLASARLRAQDPVTAIGLFEEAERSGQMGADQIADRGLAYDLVSDNVTAQRYYRQALAAGAGDEAVRRLALSLAIMGDRRAVETALAPLLQKQDRAAWRIRAFAFAILGREEEAVAIAQSTMPPELANGMAPYLRYMRKLTPAQQAAAANLGFFPQASMIGQDNARIAEWVAGHGIKRMALLEAPLVPAGAPLGAAKVAAADPSETASKDARQESRKGNRSDRNRTKPEPKPAAEPPPEPQPSRQVSAAAPVELAAASARVSAPAALAAAAAPSPTRTANPAASPVAARPAAAAGGFDLARAAPSASAPAGPSTVGPKMEPAPQPVPEPASPAAAAFTTPPEPAPAPKPAAKSAAKPAPKPSFAELFQDMGQVSAEPVPAAGAVDIRKLAVAPAPTKLAEKATGKAGEKAGQTSADKAAAEKTGPDKSGPEKADKATAKSASKKPEKTPPPPAHPSRIWAQVGVGRDTSRFAFDWRRLLRENPELFKGRKGFFSDMGRTNRLITGPFDTEAEAKAYVNRLHKGGLEDAYVWISPAGQAVDPV